ncbi:hypothetical protein GCM10010503_55750 [Streptomyces lucensis JCM 4490]|uniref:Uncharacterized protein n=1 Tax=Streptomyces lucensis JCM 4490 TaxID=1306176 RepID=A0A918JCM7_9ACTN|nr:hypothetical protein [Streptomyces lucensis]GGW71197.1 hypothetical protein GCM10010503_55750 [Streptomyces lucensis JCM 4490]
MVTEIPRAAVCAAGEPPAHADTLRADADLMDDCARRLLGTAAMLTACPAAPRWSGPALARQAAACTTAARQLRAAAEALSPPTRAGA